MRAIIGSKRFLVFIAFIAFISLGMPDGLIGVAYPSIRESFDLPINALGSLAFVGVLGYLLSSFNSGQLVAYLGVGRLLALSCLFTGAALVGYTLVPVWELMVALGFVAGLGAGAIDAGLNTYSAIHFSARVMFGLHAMFGVGVTAGPIIMTTGLQVTDSWRTGYLVVGAFQLILATSFLFTAHLWEITNPQTTESAPAMPFTSTLRLPAVWFGLLFFFAYTGLEAGVGQWSFTLFTQSRGVERELAGAAVSAYWGIFTVGRVTAGLISHRIGETGLFRLCMGGMMLGAGLIWLNPSLYLGLLGLPLMGFALAPMFPAMISNTVQRVGESHTPNTIGFQISLAALGGGSWQVIIGLIAREISLESIGACFFVVTLALAMLYEVNRWLMEQRTTAARSLL